MTLTSQLPKPDIAVIGGTGFESLPNFVETGRFDIVTPYGLPSSQAVKGALGKTPIIFLARHGLGHTIAPHRVNYRANMHVLKSCGAKRIIAFAAVGGIGAGCKPGCIVIPDQIIDYTWGREHTYYDGNGSSESNEITAGHSVLDHIEFASPFHSQLRDQVIAAANLAGVAVIDRGTYAITQGPRLETAAEIDRMEKDGADIVGMTGMPEAALARELSIPYATIAMVVNEAAGRGKRAISMEEIKSSLAGTTRLGMKILEAYCGSSMGQTPTMAPNLG